MKNFLTLLFSCYFLTGAVILPNSDFALLSELNDIYNDYIKINGKTSFSCFLDEQFIESFELFDMDTAKENNHQKEQKPVPINCYLAHQSSALNIQTFEMEFTEPSPVLEYNPYYQEFFISITSGYIFHPPRTVA